MNFCDKLVHFLLAASRKKIVMAQVTCSECNGMGWTPNPDMDTSVPDSPDNVDCEACSGDGWIDEEDKEDEEDK